MATPDEILLRVRDHVSWATERGFLDSELERFMVDWEHAKAAARMFPFRAGDHVKHFGTGEEWVLACDQDGDDVFPAGWPETRARAAHCRLIKAATDAEREEMLREASKPGEQSMRRSRAAAQLAALELDRAQANEGSAA